MTSDAVVLAGGRASRLGGLDKPALEVAGRTLLDRALTATSTAGARTRVVVGPPRDVPPGVLVVREEPSFGGPVAALAAGLAALPPDADVVVVLAADLPAVEAALPQVLGDPGGADGRLAVDPAGRDQPLLAVYRATALRGALDGLRDERGTLDGAALRALLDRLDLDRVPLGAGLCDDVDAPADARRAGIGLPDLPSLEHA